MRSVFGPAHRDSHQVSPRPAYQKRRSGGVTFNIPSSAWRLHVEGAIRTYRECVRLSPTTLVWGGQIVGNSTILLHKGSANGYESVRGWCLRGANKAGARAFGSMSSGYSGRYSSLADVCDAPAVGIVRTRHTWPRRRCLPADAITEPASLVVETVFADGDEGNSCW